MPTVRNVLLFSSYYILTLSSRTARIYSLPTASLHSTLGELTLKILILFKGSVASPVGVFRVDILYSRQSFELGNDCVAAYFSTPLVLPSPSIRSKANPNSTVEPREVLERRLRSWRSLIMMDLRLIDLTKSLFVNSGPFPSFSRVF